MKNFKRILACVLTVMMVLPLMMASVNAATAENTNFVSNTGFSFAGGNWKAYAYNPYSTNFGADWAILDNAGQAVVDSNGQLFVYNLAQSNGVLNARTPITALSSTNTTVLDGFYFCNGNLAASSRYPEFVSYAFSEEEFGATLDTTTFNWTDGFAQATNCSIQNGLIITLIHSSNDLSNSVAVYDQIKAYVVVDGTVVSAQGLLTDNQGATFGLVIGFAHDIFISTADGKLKVHIQDNQNGTLYNQTYTFDTLDISSLKDTKSYHFTMGVGTDDDGTANTNGSAHVNLAKIGTFTYDATTDSYTAEGTVNSADWTGNAADVVAPVEGDVVVQGDYTYTYKANNILGAGTGWNVVATDKTKASYGEIASEINGAPVVAMAKTFDGCTNMTAAPAIPASVNVMYNTFKGTAITAAPAIPEGVVKLYGTFKGCTALTAAPAVPSTVTTMAYCYSGCSALVDVADIPAGVTNLTATFKNCTALTAAPAYTAETIAYIFDGCTSLTGDVALTSNDAIHAFRRTAITSVTVSNTTAIARGTFSGCDALTTVNFEGAMSDWAKLSIESYNVAFKQADVNFSVTEGLNVSYANGRMYICELENIKDVFIANGTQGSYRQVANNKVVMATGAKAANGFYSYAVGAGDYTVYVRYLDGTYARIFFTAE